MPQPHVSHQNIRCDMPVTEDMSNISTQAPHHQLDSSKFFAPHLPGRSVRGPTYKVRKYVLWRHCFPLLYINCLGVDLGIVQFVRIYKSTTKKNMWTIELWFKCLPTGNPNRPFPWHHPHTQIQTYHPNVRICKSVQIIGQSLITVY